MNLLDCIVCGAPWQGWADASTHAETHQHAEREAAHIVQQELMRQQVNE